MNNFLEGKKTYTGLIIILIGFFGGARIITDTEVAIVVDNILQLAGIAIAVYGRHQAKPK